MKEPSEIDFIAEAQHLEHVSKNIAKRVVAFMQAVEKGDMGWLS